MGGENRKIPIFCWFCWPRLISRELCFMGYPGENRRLSEDTVSTLEMHHAFRQQFRAELAGSLKHEKATGWLSRRSKGENSLLSSYIKLLINSATRKSWTRSRSRTYDAGGRVIRNSTLPRGWNMRNVLFAIVFAIAFGG